MCARIFLLGVVCAACMGCENQSIGATEAGALGGAALGAGLGAIVGHKTGEPGAGVAIGAAAGALSGGLIGRQIDNRNEEVAAAEARIAEQQRALEENRRLIEELRRRGSDVRSTDRGIVVNLPDILFEFGKARLTSSALGNVRDIAEVVRETDPARRIFVEGHTDSVGSISFNQRLSEDRAASVARELTSNGVQRNRIYVRGLGETDPIASNSSEQGRQRNRRVEVIIEHPRS
ncbi:MAG: OmpA family protein [Bdellovibrionota bacterium]|nr:MAG: OmpA family protein [Bdellovibrionota bacterium]